MYEALSYSCNAVQVLLARISGALQQDPLPRSVEQMLLIVELLVEEGNLVDPQVVAQLLVYAALSY